MQWLSKCLSVLVPRLPLFARPAPIDIANTRDSEAMCRLPRRDGRHRHRGATRAGRNVSVRRNTRESFVTMATRYRSTFTPADPVVTPTTEEVYRYVHNVTCVSAFASFLPSVLSSPPSLLPLYFVQPPLSSLPSFLPSFLAFCPISRSTCSPDKRIPLPPETRSCRRVRRD